MCKFKTNLISFKVAVLLGFTSLTSQLTGEFFNRTAEMILSHQWPLSVKRISIGNLNGCKIAAGEKTSGSGLTNFAHSQSQ